MFLALQQAPKAVIVRVAEQPVESTSVTDILIGAIGLTGVLLLAAVLLGAVLGGALIGIKLLRAKYNLEPPSDRDALRVTPNSTT
jgi:hypothetical protein